MELSLDQKEMESLINLSFVLYQHRLAVIEAYESIDAHIVAEGAFIDYQTISPTMTSLGYSIPGEYRSKDPLRPRSNSWRLLGSSKSICC